jgi:hypothetical protein
MSTDEKQAEPETETQSEGDEPSAQELARKKEEESEQAKEEMKELEESDELPKDPSDWPSGPAKYETFGLNDDSYGDGVTEKLGPANLERHEDGSVSIDGEKVDNPEDYKGEPIVTAIDKAKDEDEDEESGESKDSEESKDSGDEQPAEA